ncbi:MAG: hypothetical protein AB7N76_35845 [Planctomycetota bacterium]
MAHNPNEIIATDLTEDGVQTWTRGHLASDFLRASAAAFLRNLAAEDYAEYRQLKHPCGPGSATPESRLVAHAFALQRASALALEWAKEAGA